MASDRTVYVIDDDIDVRESLVLLVQRTYRTVAFESARAFLAARVSAKDSCALVDIRMPEMNGLQLQREIRRTMPEMPVIIMTGHGDVPMAVQAMKDGAIEFLEKPFEKAIVLGALEAAFLRSTTSDNPKQEPRKALTDREKEVFSLLVEGHQNKVVGHKLGISTRTVEVHRRRIMDKLNAKNLADLVRHALSR
ncbi:MAG TPA: response regulator [Rhizomicrobium sp.]|jgi:two-component system response regulator FixJ|nr:response regulator [Rhizomicrobium sp.]